jgi:energy-converting hydrogenase B subunit D
VSTVQAIATIVVAVSGGMVALAHDPLRQTLLLGIYGLSLSILFFSLQAPDVALSEIVVSTVGLPVIILAALRRIRAQERASHQQDEDT